MSRIFTTSTGAQTANSGFWGNAPSTFARKIRVDKRTKLTGIYFQNRDTSQVTVKAVLYTLGGTRIAESNATTVNPNTDAILSFISPAEIEPNTDFYIGVYTSVGRLETYIAENIAANVSVTRDGVTFTFYPSTFSSTSDVAPNGSTVSTSELSIGIEFTTNNLPTLNLASPTDNQTLSEGNQLQVEGSATEADSGNVVTVKYRINDGPTRAIASGVSDGSTPISFARTLRYSIKRIWDGSTDVTGVDLAEETDHVLKVWAEDDQGGRSEEVIRYFRVIWNRPPAISGANEDLGTIMEPPSKTYTVTDPEGNPFTITEKIDGKVIRTFPGVPGREETVTIPHDMWIRLDLDTPHELTVEAADDSGLTSTRVYTFVRTDTHIEFMLNFDNPAVEAHFTLDGMPKRVLVKLERYLPPGSEIEFVRVTNNAMDEEPVWEDTTAAVLAGRGHLFQNQTKTAESWRINIWVRIAKGTATERVLLNGYGGAFD